MSDQPSSHVRSIVRAILSRGGQELALLVRDELNFAVVTMRKTDDGWMLKGQGTEAYADEATAYDMADGGPTRDPEPIIEVRWVGESARTSRGHKLVTLRKETDDRSDGGLTHWNLDWDTPLADDLPTWGGLNRNDAIETAEKALEGLGFTTRNTLAT